MPNSDVETLKDSEAVPPHPGSTPVTADTEARISAETEAASEAKSPLPELDALRNTLAEIHELIERRLSRDTAKEEAFNYLYAELEGLKRRAALLDLKPLYIDLILLYDRMDSACRNTGGTPEPLISSLRDELKEVLFRRDIQLIGTGDGTFNPRLQRAVGVEPAVTQEGDGKVLRILRDGFACEQLIIRPQEVVIARFDPTRITPPRAEASSPTDPAPESI